MAIIFLEHIRQHVVSVAGDMVSTLGLVEPLVSLDDFSALGREKEHAGRVLRELLTWNLVLFVTRLHESANSGRTGETASIDALLDYARGQVPDDVIADLKQQRQDLIKRLEADGVAFEDLYAFRTAAIAHSIHRTSTASDNNIRYSTIADFALKTYAVVLAIEQELVATGSTKFMDMPDLVDVWKMRGSNFWKELPRARGASSADSVP
jgi:hypothetical protein